MNDVRVKRQTLLSFAIGLLLFSSVFDLSRLGVQSDAAQTANSWLKIVCAGIAGGVVVVSVARVRALIWRNGTALWLYVAIAVASAFWTIDLPATMVGIGGLLVFAAVAAASTLLPARQVLIAVRSSSEAVVLSSLLVYWVDDSLATAYSQGINRLAGVTFGPHPVARCAAVALLIRAHELKSERRAPRICYRMLWIAASAMAVVLADSRQVYIATAAALVALFLPRRRPASLAYVASLGVAACAVWLAFDAAGHDVAQFAAASLARNAGEDVTALTGRVDIWEAVNGLVRGRPWTGYGFNAGGVALSREYSAGYGWTTESAHNVVLHAILDLGVGGAVLIILIMASALRRVFRSGDRVQLALVVMVVALGAVERSIAGSAGFLFLVVAAVYLREHTKRVYYGRSAADAFAQAAGET